MTFDSLRDHLQLDLGTAYTIERELGGGGMSRVFVAEEARFHRHVVVKVLTPELAAGVSATRFEREIQLVAALQQANIVPLLSAGETNGLPYYTMPFVEGLSLRARLARGGTMPVAEVISVLRDVTRALAYAHEHGVVHRDIKPENILISGDAAVVTDFGIAKALLGARGEGPGASHRVGGHSTLDPGPSTLTALGTSLGTPAYMSPEQASGDPATDHRTDFYALGCVAYEMLTGAPPFAGRPVHQLVAAHMTETPPAVGTKRSDCPPGLAALVMRCLEKDPARRPQAAREILQMLDTVTTPGAGVASAATPRKWLVAGVVAVVLVVVAVGAWVARRGGSSINSVAVLPFENVGGDSSQEYFSDGLADEVSSALAQVPGIRVAARSSANMFKGKQPDPKDVGVKLHVGGIVEGSVRRFGNRLRVTTELISASDGLSLWSKTYERDANQAPALQSDITDGVVSALRVSLAGDAAAATPPHMPGPAAYDDYLKGNFYLERGSRADIEKAMALFNSAIAADSAYAEPWIGIATAYEQLADAYLPPAQAYPKAREAAQHAIALDPASSAAHSALGFVSLEYDWNWAAAKREIDRALALNPSNASAVQSRGFLDWVERDSVSGLREFQRYVSLDPLSPFAHEFLADIYGIARMADSSISQYQQAQELSPGYAYGQPVVDEAYRLKGRLDDALRVNIQAEKQFGHPLPGAVLTLVAMGRRDDARRKLAELTASVAKGMYQPPELIARCFAALGETDSALVYLRKGVEGHSSFAPLATYYAELRQFRNDPRYAPLKEEMNLH